MKLNEKYKGCLYCSPNPKDRVPIVENSSDFLAIENDGTVAFGNDGAVTHYERLLNFCPMCGRELNNGKKAIDHGRQGTVGGIR